MLIAVATVVLTLVFGFVPALLGGFGLVAGIFGTIVGLLAGVFGVVVGLVVLAVTAAVLLAPIWLPILLIVGIVALCRKAA